jgi:hypothetical protein
MQEPQLQPDEEEEGWWFGAPEDRDQEVLSQMQVAHEAQGNQVLILVRGRPA